MNNSTTGQRTPFVGVDHTETLLNEANDKVLLDLTCHISYENLTSCMQATSTNMYNSLKLHSPSCPKPTQNIPKHVFQMCIHMAVYSKQKIDTLDAALRRLGASTIAMRLNLPSSQGQLIYKNQHWPPKYAFQNKYCVLVVFNPEKPRTLLSYMFKD